MFIRFSLRVDHGLLTCVFVLLILGSQEELISVPLRNFMPNEPMEIQIGKEQCKRRIILTQKFKMIDRSPIFYVLCFACYSSDAKLFNHDSIIVNSAHGVYPKR